MEELNRDEQKEVEKYFKSSILPVLSPQIIDPRHPFPHLNNKQLTVAATLEQKDHRLLGLIPLPSMIQRLFFLSGEERRFLLAEDIIRFYAEQVFQINKVSHAAVICVTRNADLDTDAGFDEDLDYRQYMSNMLKKRRRLTPVRLEVQGALAEESMKFLCQKLKLTPAPGVLQPDPPGSFLLEPAPKGALPGPAPGTGAASLCATEQPGLLRPWLHHRAAAKPGGCAAVFPL